MVSCIEKKPRSLTFTNGILANYKSHMKGLVFSLEQAYIEEEDPSSSNERW
jgi:hypothetical protein